MEMSRSSNIQNQIQTAPLAKPRIKKFSHTHNQKKALMSEKRGRQQSGHFKLKIKKLVDTLDTKHITTTTQWPH